jgi:protein-S-isoprenylcysteine O-methyltransferase Ste14
VAEEDVEDIPKCDRYSLNYINQATTARSRARSVYSRRGMSVAETSESGQIRGSSAVVRVGGWLFKRRTWLPLPLVAALLLIPARPPRSSVLMVGLALVAAGELLRLWAVRHIGVVSRTRSQRTGPLVSSGPFEHVRNPLYIGNVALWAGFAFGTGLAWLTPLVVLALGTGYHAIVRWEESLLEARLGQEYRSYAARVPRWIPSFGSPNLRAADNRPMFSWRQTLFSERGTLLAIAAGCLLLWVKFRLTARS